MSNDSVFWLSLALLAEGNIILVVWTVGRIMLDWSVGKIIILSFRLGSTKNKNIDHWGKEAYAVMSTQVPYEIDHISLLRSSTMSSAL